MLTIEIENSGAAFDDPRPELARILRDLASKLENGRNPTSVRDINGNLCGQVYLDIEEAEQ